MNQQENENHQNVEQQAHQQPQTENRNQEQHNNQQENIVSPQVINSNNNQNMEEGDKEKEIDEEQGKQQSLEGQQEGEDEDDRQVEQNEDMIDEGAQQIKQHTEQIKNQTKHPQLTLIQNNQPKLTQNQTFQKQFHQSKHQNLSNITNPLHQHPHPHKKHQQKSDTKLLSTLLTPQPLSLKYLNSLENTLQSKERQIRQITAKSSLQASRIVSLQKSYSEAKETLTQLTTQLQTQSAKEEKQALDGQADKGKIKQLEDELSSYRSIGNIKLLQKEVEEFKVLVEMQKSEIKLLRQVGENGSGLNEMGVREYVVKMQTLQRQKEELEARLQQSELNVGQKIKENVASAEIINKMDETIKNQIQIIKQLESALDSSKNDRLNDRNNLEQKIKDLQKYIKNNTEEQKDFSEKQRIQKQKQDSSLLVQKEKDIVFREYLKLQIQFKNLQQHNNQLKLRFQQTSKDLRICKKEMIPKKDYDQVFKKYKKCKVCLQKAITQNKLLRNSNLMSDQIQSEGRIGTTILNEQQSTMKKYMQVFNHHVQQSIGYFKQTNSIMEDLHMQKITQQLTSSKIRIQQVEERNLILQNLNDLFEREIIYKNTLLDRAVLSSKALRTELEKLRKQKLQIQTSLSQNLSAKNSLQRLEAKSANLLLRNRKIVSEKQNWKQLYTELREKYEAFVARDPNLSVQNKIIQSKQKQKKNQKEDNLDFEEGEIEEQSDKKQQKVKKIVQSSQTQTQNQNSYHYRQLKETLTALKKFPKEIEAGQQLMKNTIKSIEQYKNKYNQLNGKFNTKFRALQTQKNENESWREKTKAQIIGDFEQIRGLIDNDRLVNCLRKAKNLIEELEQGDEEKMVQE